MPRPTRNEAVEAETVKAFRRWLKFHGGKVRLTTFDGERSCEFDHRAEARHMAMVLRWLVTGDRQALPKPDA